VAGSGSGEEGKRFMKRTHVIVLFAAGAFASAAPQASTAQTAVRVAFCTSALSSAVAPFAVATNMGWWAAAGIKVEVELVPLPGPAACMKAIASRDMPYGLPTIDALAIVRQQGVKAKGFYTAYQGSIFGIAVPADSPIKSFAELKGKRIGVTSMASTGVVIARALAATHGWNPDRDISIVEVGGAAQTAAMVRDGQIEALSLFDTQYALVENAGAEVRLLEKDNLPISLFPSNGFIALEETLATKRAEAVALAQGYAKGTIFAMANPLAAIRILWEVFPAAKATGKTERDALLPEVKTLMARASNWRLEPAGVTRWGENSEKNYAAYIAFLVKNGVLKEKVDVGDLVTNELIDDINKFDAAAIATMAKNYK
jgi:NitT/TauT family transport system substrate-binding protein